MLAKYSDVIPHCSKNDTRFIANKCQIPVTTALTVVYGGGHVRAKDTKTLQCLLILHYKAQHWIYPLKCADIKITFHFVPEMMHVL